MQKKYKEQMVSAMAEVVFSSKLRHSIAARRYRKGVAKLSIFIQDKIKSNVLSSFMHTKFVSLQSKKQVLNVRSIVIHHAMNKFRDYFVRWRQESQRLQVVAETEEEGRVRMQVSKVRQEFYNLKELLKSEGFPPGRIEEIV